MSVLEKLDRVEYLLKHLPGRHSQLLHTPHKFRVGSKAPVDLNDDPDLHEFYMDGVERGIYSGSPYQKPEIENLPAWGEDAKFKDKVVTQLSKDTGLDYDRVNDLVASWAVSSNDSNPESLAMQRAVSDEFGVKMTDWQKDRERHLLTSEKAWTTDGTFLPLDERQQRYDAALGDGRKVVRAMYDNTQRDLASAGVEKVRLFRGANYEKPLRGKGRYVEEGETVVVRSNALESWSSQADVASSFATPYVPEDTGYVFAAEFPADRVLSTPRTGFGALNEFEFVVLGNAVGEVDEVVVLEENLFS